MTSSLSLLAAWSVASKPVIGMVHLRPLAGAPKFAGDFNAVRDAALADADALVSGGVQGLMVENFGDVPFYPGMVPGHVIAQMTAIAVEIRRRFAVPLGINVLRNDGRSALAIAHAAGAEFIRVNVLCGARVADQGILQGIAHDLLRDRTTLGAGRIQIIADVDVKHSVALSERPLLDEVDDTLRRGLADALVVSGAGTGKPTDVSKVAAVKSAAGRSAVFVGSGVTPASVHEFLPHADGFIVGSAFKRDNDPNNPVLMTRVADLIRELSSR